MACDFAAYRIAGSKQVVLVHQPVDATDTGFGAVQSSSKVTIETQPAAPQNMKGYLLWLPTVIIAELPDAFPAGPATVRVTIAGAQICRSSAVLDDAGTALPSDLIFAVAIPEIAAPGEVITVVNLKPGFVWEQRHTPVKLHRLDGQTSHPVTVVAGLGSARLSLKLPAGDVLALQSELEQMLLGFGADPQRVLVTLKRDPKTLPVWADTAIASPTIVGPGATVTLDVLEPALVFPAGEQFRFRKADLGELRLFQAHSQIADPVVSGWETPQLSIKLPDTNALNFAPGVDTPVALKFEKRNVPIALSVRIPPLPQLLWWLRVGRLTCDRKNEWSTDEVRLEFRFDNARTDQFPRIRPGEPDHDHIEKVGDFIDYDDWTGPFVQGAEMALWEIDNGKTALIDPDDRIGAVKNLPTGNSGSVLTHTFSGEGAIYTLSYFVQGFTGLPL